MSMEEVNPAMTIENLKMKLENQANLIKQLTNENEELYHQFNHLMIRNGKMLKRVDDLQKIIDDMHVRIEELQLINGNMMNLNDSLRRRTSTSPISTQDFRHDVFQRFQSDSLHFQTGTADFSQQDIFPFDLKNLFLRWKNFPGQVAQNAPNLRKQMLMLAYLYINKTLSANELFQICGIGGVTGARYVATLKKFGLIRFTGARKKGSYEITNQGRLFIEERQATDSVDLNKSLPEIPQGIPVKTRVVIPNPTVLDKDDF